MQKFKSIKWSFILNILKCCLLGIVVTLIGIVIFAVVLKFVDLNSTVISYVNDIIKGVSIFIMMLCIKKLGEEKLLIKSIFAGILYAVLSFIVFSILNGGFAFNLAFIYDLLFAVIVAVLISIIFKILQTKTV